MTNPPPAKISIILPTYNGAKYIRQSIESCLNQTYKDIELIIVDDGSTDETPEVIKSYKDERIKYLRHERNRGLPHALNTGFADSIGDYLTWTSDDNEYLPEAMEKMLDFLNKNEDADFVYADYWAYYQEKGIKDLRRLPDKLDLRKENGIGACFMYTRRVYQHIGDFNERYELVEDYDYWIRICSKYKPIHYPHPLYIYTEHPKSLKSTRHLEIVLFDSILKYRNNYITLSQLGQSNFLFLYNVFRCKRAKNEVVFVCLRAILKIHNLSVFLGLLCSLSLVSFLVPKLLSYCLEYVDFAFSFKRKCSQLKITKDKKNILCIVPYIVMGGAERTILNIAEGLDQRDFGFHLVTTTPANNIWYSKFRPHFQNILIPTKRVTSENICRKYFCELIRKLNIGIVLISNSSIGYKYLPQLKSEFKYLKTIDILHAEASLRTADELAWGAHYLDRRICISDHLMEYMIKKYEGSDIGDRYIRRLKVIRNGVDLKEYNPNILMKGRFKSEYRIPEDAKIICFIGRFSWEKNPLLFVDIAKHVIVKLPHHKLRFVMAGGSPGSDYDKVRNVIHEYGIENYFILTGVVDNVAQLLADAYVLLVTSKSEEIPFVILEAMAMKIPVIGVNVGAMYEVIRNNINGILLNAENNVEEAFTNRIADLLSGNQDYEELAEKARETIVSEYSLETMRRTYQGIFEEIAGENGGIFG